MDTVLPGIHRALYAYLSTLTALTALIGTRCFAGVAPSTAAFPYLCIHETMVDSIYHLSGASSTFETQMQIECWALDMLMSKRLAKIVRLALEARPMVLDGLEVDGIFVEQELDLPEFAEDGSEKVYYRRLLLVSVWHERDIV